ncbi:hypothetical protein C8R44DRAFT_753870 [Mycena epipterygia]|nr:hypothetical protein C8R44DRAFT_753870 [Mycena epipterygia]
MNPSSEKCSVEHRNLWLVSAGIVIPGIQTADIQTASTLGEIAPKTRPSIAAAKRRSRGLARPRQEAAQQIRGAVEEVNEKDAGNLREMRSRWVGEENEAGRAQKMLNRLRRKQTKYSVKEKNREGNPTTGSPAQEKREQESRNAVETE